MPTHSFNTHKVEWNCCGRMSCIGTGADPDFVKGGPQLPRPKVADVAKRALSGRGPGRA